MRPNIYSRREQDSIRFHLDKDVKRLIKIYATLNETSFQEIFEAHAKEIADKQKGVDINE